MHTADPSISTSVLEQQRAAAKQLKEEWRDKGTADAVAAISMLGGSGLHKSIALDLAYEDYCLKREAGEELDTSEFVQQFPSISLSLRRQICIHDALSGRGALDDTYDLPEWPEIGDVVAGFLLTEELGRGAFGRVFRASEISLRERQVVVKLAKHGLHEAQLLAQVPHAGVVPVYSVSTDEEWGLTALCMPFISRATLLDIIEILHGESGYPRSARQLADAARSVNCEDDVLLPQMDSEISTTRGTFADAVTVFGFLIAEALKETHSKEIYHRDLKPSNILVDQFGCPMLIDFNLSTEPLGDVPLGGTLPYMAPEQIMAYLDASRGEDIKEHPGAQADLFSLGVCLYELVYGAHPFSPIPMDQSNVDLASYLLERHALGPRRVEKTESLVDSHLRTILARCLEFDVSRRPQSAAELAGEFRRSLTVTNKLKRFALMHRRSVGLGALALGASIVTAGFWYAGQPTWQQRDLTAAEQAMQTSAFATAKEHLDNLLSESPDDPALLMMRGNASLKMGQTRSALEDYNRANDINASIGLATRIAYCNIQLGHYDVAAKWYREILDEFPDAEVIHNNLGYAYAQDSLFNAAIEHFDKTIEMNPGFWTAYLNRADAIFQQALRQREATPQSALDDIEIACRNLVPSGDKYLLACRMCCNTNEPDEQFFLRYLARAIEDGVTRQRLESEDSFDRMWNDPRAAALLEQAPQTGSMTRAVRVIPPW
jgi:serine/threonine protein kinase